MEKPRVICLMMSSVDGKILSADWGESDRIKEFRNWYGKAHETFNAEAWMCGRVTMELDFTEGLKPELKQAVDKVDRTDFVADNQASSFAVAVDAHGKLGWDSNEIEGDHIIEILTEAVDDAYLLYLQERKISYIFAGPQELDFRLALHKLATLFPIKTLMLEGGGNLNGSLLNESLIDEVSLIILPLADGTPKTSTVFDITGAFNKKPGAFLQLQDVEKFEDGVVWLKYKVEQ